MPENEAPETILAVARMNHDQNRRLGFVPLMDHFQIKIRGNGSFS